MNSLGVVLLVAIGIITGSMLALQMKAFEDTLKLPNNATWSYEAGKNGTYVTAFDRIYQISPSSSAGSNNGSSSTATPAIVSFAPLSPVSDFVGATRTFNMIVDQTVNVSWSINGKEVLNQTEVTESSYTSMANPGTWNVIANAQNKNGTVTRTWDWIVLNQTTDSNSSFIQSLYSILMSLLSPGDQTASPAIVGFAPPSPVFDTEGASRTFDITANQIANVTWYINGIQVQYNESMTQARYTHANATLGTWNVNAVASNTNGTIMQNWLWVVSEATPSNQSSSILMQTLFLILMNLLGGPGGQAASSPPAIVDFAPLSPVSDVVGATRTFNITVNQSVNVSWYINGKEVASQVGVTRQIGVTSQALTESSYTNTSAALGTWNVAAVARNQNGTAMKTWDWIVSEAAGSGGGSSSGGSGGGDSGSGSSSSDSGGGYIGVCSGEILYLGSIISPEKFNNIEVSELKEMELCKDLPTLYRFINPSLAVDGLIIKAKVNAGIMPIKVEQLKNTSSIIASSPQGIIYKNINIWVGLPSKYIKYSIIKFRVSNSWLTRENINPSRVSMLRWDGKWNEISTGQIGKDANFTYYEARTNSFSPFAIIAKPEPALQPEIPAPTPAPSLMEFDELPSSQSTPSPTVAQMLAAILWLNSFFIKPHLGVLIGWIIITILSATYYRGRLK